MERRRILVVEDQKDIADLIAMHLRDLGHQVDCAHDGGKGYEAARAGRYDLVVLDVMLPVRSGLDVLRELRSRSDLPVILLTARSDETDRVLGLELGSDDYLVKPFSPRELTARVRSVLRRTMAHATASSAGRTAQVTLQFGPLVIDRAAREISVDGTIVSLTAKEFDLLAHLAAHPRQVFSRAQLLNAVWDSDPAFQDPATVTVHVGRLRSKIEADPEHPRWIVTVFGVGYRFEP